jgi:hypothetical protein
MLKQQKRIFVKKGIIVLYISEYLTIAKLTAEILGYLYI